MLRRIFNRYDNFFILNIGGGPVEDTIKRIISIDKEADNFRRINDEILVKKKRELQSEIKKITEENSRFIEAEKKRINEEEMKKAENEIEKLRVNEEEKIQRITTAFNNIKKGIIEETFNKLIHSFEEV